MTDNFKNKIEYGASELGITLSDQAIESLFVYYEMLIEKNKVMNLTTVTDENEVIEKHFIDSLSVLKYVRSDISGSVLDVGTGAGFPGVVLSIAIPDCHVTMLDAVNKKLVFINEVIDVLSLKNADTVHGRAEDLGHDKRFREHFDVVTARAVANLSTLCEYCIPFTRMDGRFIAYKSGNIDEELAGAEHALTELNSKVSALERFKLPGTDLSRSMLTINRTGKLLSIYPRKAGLPSKEPL